MWPVIPSNELDRLSSPVQDSRTTPEASAGPKLEAPPAFHASFTALVTPFDNDGVAKKTFADLVAWQIDEGVQGLVVCSATGEGRTLTPQERVQVLRLATEAAGNRASIVADTGTDCTRESVSLTRAAQSAGATAALIVTPSYNKPSPAGLFRHYYEIARSVDIPLIVGIDPVRTGVDIGPDTLARLAEIENIVGLVDATGDFDRFPRHAFSLRSEFARLSGDDHACLMFRMAGGHGSVSIVANAVPKIWSEMQQASTRGDWARAAMIQKQLLPLLSAFRMEAGPGPIKYALSYLRPWFNPNVRLPLVPVKYETGSAVVAALRELELID
ncbi:4-hydroxy-tetrahydrodipicolinate synthase [Methylosinus sp. PW1]|uniref:4-hydroxy-tetrahydrodipicolinate synthase n=1 Tax=Methylosinus sp. PW1 TaxID=107636 RepID=UPI000A069E4B|nr:4-hydroxy-tetrahydrodipicolinate synthase [Methylosinus sp. PW1]